MPFYNRLKLHQKESGQSLLIPRQRGQAPLKFRQEGQALLIILLLMAVVLTIALSIVSRSITDITISQKEEESARAFSAAEAGIERAILGDFGAGQTSGELSTGGNYIVSSGQVVGGTAEYSLPSLLSSGDIATVWLVSHDSEENLTCSDGKCFTGSEMEVCWGAKGSEAQISDQTPAIEISVVYTQSGGGGQTMISRDVYDPNTTRTSVNKFSRLDGSDLGACTVESTEYAFRKRIDLTSLLGASNLRADANQITGPQFARIRFFYNTAQGHPIAVKSPNGSAFPEQGNKIVSTGFVGEVTRKVEVTRLFSDLPPIFDSGIFSNVGGIVKSE